MSVHTSTETETVARVLGEATSRHFGSPATIERLSRQSGGASRQTWSFDAVVNGECQPLILRRDPPTQGKTDRERAVAIDRATEFRVLQAAHAAGVRSPEPLFELTPQDALGEAYVMRRIGGIAIARKLLRDAPYEAARSRIAGQLGEILARIHATDLTTLPSLRRREAADHIAELHRSLDALGRPQPVFELGLSWLDRRKPAPLERPVLVHGDYRTGNYLVDETGVTTILDWELAHLGDPVEDLGWLCVKSWRFGAIDKPAGGFGSREELWAAYERAGGGKVDPARAHWWEVFGTVHWGIICLNQAWKHLSGSIKSMEHASIGRRAVETEVDLLQLLKQGA
jgi:aminoglycoside phosphotransferase (APT) family kinase protein